MANRFRSGAVSNDDTPVGNDAAGEPGISTRNNVDNYVRSGSNGGGGRSRGTSFGGSSVSGGGSTSIFDSVGVGGRGRGEGANSDGKSSSFFAGGMSINGDSSMFSSAGFLGQQGTVTKGTGKTASADGSGFASKGFDVSGGIAKISGLSGTGDLPLRNPFPPTEEPRLGWLVQDSPDNKNSDFFSGSLRDPALTDHGAGGCYDEILFNDNAFPTSYDSKWISQQYQEQGLDFLSGGQDGFGAIKGTETNSSGESSHRSRTNNIPYSGSSGVVGNTGVIMGGDFATYGNSNAGDGQRHQRSSAKYSGGGGFSGIDYVD